MTHLVNLIYASSATRLMTDQDLLDILEKSRRNNTQRGLTGMLLYRGGNFLQVLEGTDEAVQERFNVIMGDPRHHQVILLLKRSVDKRQFEQWEMGFKNLDDVNATTIPGYTNYLNEPFSSNHFKNATFAYTFLNMFKEGMR
jgi:hypothetical protein